MRLVVRVLAGIAVVVLASRVAAAAPYSDTPTSQWFKGLSSPYAHLCCDQADCRRAASDFRDGAWWARSNVVPDKWVRIREDQIVPKTVSIFPEAILCESDTPWLSETGFEPRVYCFVVPPIGF